MLRQRASCPVLGSGSALKEAFMGMQSAVPTQQDGQRLFRVRRRRQQKTGLKELHSGTSAWLEDDDLGLGSKLLPKARHAKLISEILPRLRQAWRRLSVGSLLRALWLEHRSYLLRIGHVCRTRPDIYLTPVGPTFQVSASGSPEVCTRTRDCKRDIEKLTADYPWATMIDQRAFRDAWMRGAEWADRNSCIRDS